MNYHLSVLENVCLWVHSRICCPSVLFINFIIDEGNPNRRVIHTGLANGSFQVCHICRLHISCTCCWSLSEGSWLHCNLSAGHYHWHVVPIWIFSDNFVLDSVCVPEVIQLAVYLFPQHHLCHICMVYCIQNVSCFADLLVV